MSNSPEKYDEDYFQRGVETGKSLYSNYRWIPELTIPLAHRLIVGLDISTGAKVLDYGCAYGYLVKALRLLGIDAWGADVSRHALNNAPKDVAQYLDYTDFWFNNPRSEGIDVIIAKDVLEHVPEGELPDLLGKFNQYARRVLAVIPLGSNGKFTIPSHNFDPTHITAQPLLWWKSLFRKAGFDHVSGSYSWDGLKTNWTKEYKNGTGFIYAEHY